MLQYIVAGIVSISLLVYYLLTSSFNHWKARNIPGPKPLPLFGNIKDCATRKENAAETFKKIYDQFPNEPVVGIFRMTSPCLVIRDLDIIKHVMIKDFDAFEDRGVEYSKEGLGANLFHADGDTWRALRYKFTPMFTTGKLKGMMYLITEQCDKFIDFLDESVNSNPEQEIYYHIKRFTTATIMSCAFGLSVDTLSDESTLMQTLSEIDKLTVRTHMLHEVDMMFPGLFKSLNMSLFPARVQTFFEKMVSSVINERGGKPSNRNDFMDLCLEMREMGEVSSRHEVKKASGNSSLQLTDSIIAAQVFVFYVGGYETSASMLSFMLYELSRNPDVQEKAIEEVDRVLEKHKGQITYETICDLSYVENVFNETYRKYPVVPLQRKACIDYKVPGTKITIEKGTMIVMPVLGIHYDEKLYPNPEKFDPDRFNAENSGDRHPCAFMPYGVGPRNCIGLRFGKLQTRVAALRLLSKFRVEPSPKTPKVIFDPERLLINPAGGVYLNLIPRATKSYKA